MLMHYQHILVLGKYWTEDNDNYGKLLSFVRNEIKVPR